MRKHYIRPISELVTTSLFIEICNGTMPLNDGYGGNQLTNEAQFNDDEGLQLNSQKLWEDK